MKLQDQAQNIGARIATIHIFAFILLSLLGVRLYYLQIVKGEYYEQRAENQRIRLIPIPAPRGAIFDRKGRILVDSRPTFNVVISNEPMRKMEVDDERVYEYAEGLNLEPQVIADRLKQLKGQNDFETLVLKDNASMNDIAWVEAHSLEYPELRIDLQPQRFYPHRTAMAHVLGYVGEVSSKQLETERWSAMRPGDIIGKGGLEEYYDEFLRGRPGYRKVIVDSRGRIQSEIEVVPPQSGQDMVSTIDLDVQMAAEAQLAESVTKRGTIIAMDPNNGEMLALASWPSFDPNVFVQGSKTREGRKQIAAYWQDPQRPLYNRATQGRYPPGSTWKVPMSVGGLQNGAITLDKSSLACGGGIQIGNKFTKCMGNHGMPTLGPAISRSCNGYYYRLALKMKIEGLIEMIETFEFDKQTGIDIPNERISQTPKSWKPVIEKREGRWSDIRTIYAGIGQDTVVVTPISLIRSFAAVAAHGKMYVPHFLKEFRPISSTQHFEARPGFGFQRPEPKTIKLSSEEEEVIVGGLWTAVNGGGTARGSHIPGFDVGGKTGTAQVSPTGSAIKDHAWFVSFAPAYKPEIAVLAMIENVGFGGSHAAPAAKGVYESYIAARHPSAPEPDEIAKR